MVLWGISSIFFLAETWYSFSKSSLSKYKFGEISTEQSKVTVEPTTLRCGKNPIISATKVQRTYLLWHWRVMESLKKTDLWFQRWHEEFGEFSPNHSKSEFVTSMGYFCARYMRFELKKTEELSFMTLNSDAKFE